MKHEMFPKLGATMDGVVRTLKGSAERESKWNSEDLSEGAVKEVIGGLKAKRAMTSSQVAYIKGIVRRAKLFMTTS